MKYVNDYGTSGFVNPLVCFNEGGTAKKVLIGKPRLSCTQSESFTQRG